MLHGVMMGADKVLVVPEGEGRPIVEAQKPSVPDGYTAKESYADAGDSIQQVWTLVPNQGAETDAAVALAKIQAQALDDADAVKVPALYDEWSGDGVEYKKGQRLRFQGLLVKVLQDHTSQPDWAPNAAPSLFSVILPGQEGSGVEVGVWQQPGSTNGYSTGDRVIHDGHLWESTQDNNVWKPGDVGAPWTDLGEWDGETTATPTGAHFA